MYGILPEYTHIVKPKLRNTYLSFDEKGNLVIKSPEVSQHYIEQLLLKKAEWITESREKIRQKKGKSVDFTEKSRLYFKGSSYPLKMLSHNKQKTALSFESDLFLLYFYQYNEILFRKHIDRFYKKEAEQFLPALVAKYAQQMQLFPKKIQFRKTKRQWGSCSGKNVLSFNTMLMKLPPNVIEYVVVHELAHIEHKHHQKSFWDLVGDHIPDYKACIRELHTYTT
ncbi:Putative predicted metal-dependent hydrolase [hydrothermal vent metagenome]|uniref:Putative predicted metal-dependent hydrolase n=1 Tax=hydrothermal vent metagenome TaxID=652676 RepID=A0A1W1BTR9_9ZZZZ